MAGIPNPPNLDEILSTSRMVRNALLRGGPDALNAINSPPIYCYAPQTDDVRSLLRLMFAQTSLHSLSYAHQLPDEPNPLFIYCDYSEPPVPQEFWDRLETLRALYLSVDTKGMIVKGISK